MMVKFFAHGTGGGSGPVDYLTAEREDRAHAPAEVLRGDPVQTRDLIDAIDRQWRYTSGVLSFAPEDRPSAAEQERVMDEFERVAFAGLEADRYDVLWVRHSHTDEGRTELHFVTPRMDLDTGKALNIAPPGWQRTFDPFRDAMNYEHGWARPDDPSRAREQVHTREHSNGREAPARLDSREALHAFVAQGIEDGAIEDRTGLVAALEGAGLEVPRQGRDYVTVLDPETGYRFRLKGEVYAEGWTRAAFLERGLERAEEADRAAERAAGEEAERGEAQRGDGHVHAPSLERVAEYGTEHDADPGREAGPEGERGAGRDRSDLRHELSKLGGSLRSESEIALASMQSATLDRSRRITDAMARIERRQRRTTLWIGSGVIATVLCGLLVPWGASGWTNASLERARTQLDAIRGEIAEQSRQLAIIQNQTGGLTVVSDGTGTLYAILPEGSETGYGCGGRNCVKLPPPVPIPRTRPTSWPTN